MSIFIKLHVAFILYSCRCCSCWWLIIFPLSLHLIWNNRKNVFVCFVVWWYKQIIAFKLLTRLLHVERIFSSFKWIATTTDWINNKKVLSVLIALIEHIFRPSLSLVSNLSILLYIKAIHLISTNLDIRLAYRSQ